MGIAVLVIPALFLIYYCKCCKNQAASHDGFMDYVRLSLYGSRVVNHDAENTAPPSNENVNENVNDEHVNDEHVSSVYIQDDTVMPGPSTAADYIPTRPTRDNLKTILQKKMKEIKKAVKYGRSSTIQTPPQSTSLPAPHDTPPAEELTSPPKQAASTTDPRDTSAKVAYTSPGGSGVSSMVTGTRDMEDGPRLTYSCAELKDATATSALSEPATLPYSQAAFVSVDDNHFPRNIIVTSTPKKVFAANSDLLKDISKIVSNIHSEIESGRKELMSPNDSYQSSPHQSVAGESLGDPTLLTAAMAVASLADQYKSYENTTQPSFSLQPSPQPCMTDEELSQLAETEFSEMAHTRGQTPEKDSD